MTTINPYLTFPGNCEEAFNFYKFVFGGEFGYIGRFKDMPENPEFEVPEEEKELIMHISLPIGEGTVLMGSDNSTQAPPLMPGSNFSISVNTSSKEETDRIFNDLSEGGQVIMPLSETFWGSYFGMLIDRYGFKWMVNNETKKA